MTWQTLQEVKEKIRLLSPADRDAITAWLVEVDGVKESAPAYGDPDNSKWLSFEDYLALEETSIVRHEYVHGERYAMMGASLPHNEIAVNLVGEFRQHLKGGPCRAYVSDVKLRLKVNHMDVVYYPDVMVACQRDTTELRYLRDPKLVVEVLSPSTAAVDRREKWFAYTQIPSLEEYVLVAQSAPHLVIYRRDANWVPQTATGLEALAQFHSIGLSLPLAQIYEGVLS